MTFELEGGKKIVLDAEQARRDGPTVLRQHGIVFDRSQDLRDAMQTAHTAEGAAGVCPAGQFRALSWQAGCGSAVLTCSGLGTLC